MPIAASAEPQLVIKVTGPLAKRIRMGTFLDDGKSLKLGKNDHIVIVDSKGARAFTGPKQIFLARAPLSPIGGSTIVNGMISNGEPIVRLAGVRGIGQTSKGMGGRQPNAYLRTAIKPGVGQPVCFLPTAILILERSGSNAETLTLETLANKTAATVSFVAHQKQQPWPSSHRPAVTSQFRVRGKSKSRSVTLIPVPADLTDWLELGTFLTEQKCGNGDWVLAQRDWDVRLMASPF